MATITIKNGTSGNDKLYGTQDDEQLNGLEGDDEIVGNGGHDILYGGAGNDTINGGQRFDPATNAWVDDPLGDVMDGGPGNDTLEGGPGEDTLDGGSGRNVLAGFGGNDSYTIRSTTDQIVETGGTDSATVMVNWYKPNPDVESWRWADGVQKLPYWIDALVDAGMPAMADGIGSTRTVKYSFAQAPASFFTAEDKNGFKPFTAAQMEATRKMFAYIETVLNLRFVETSDAEGAYTMVFANNHQAKSGGYAAALDPDHGSVVLLADDPRVLDPRGDNGLAFLSVAMHEVGHALGLKHPFAHADANGEPGPGPYLPAAEDHVNTTLMSYTGDPANPSVYSALDIAALQYLYGPAAANHGGNDVYKLDGRASLLVHDGAGVDSIDASQLSDAMTLYLEPGYWGYVGSKAQTITAAGQVTVNFGSVIENATGGAGNDHIVGNGAANTLRGGAGNDRLEGAGGNDVLDGGAGLDMASYAGARAAFGVTRNGDGWSVTHNGELGTDTLTGVERLLFADGALALDVDGIAAKAYRLYAAAFDRTPDLPGLGYWLAQMDKGMSLLDVANAFIQNKEFVDMYGATRTHAGFLDKLYRNILDRDPDPKGFEFWVNAMKLGVTEGEILASFSEDTENVGNVVGQIKDGIAYLPFGMG